MSKASYLDSNRKLNDLTLPRGWERKSYRHDGRDICVLEANHPADILEIPLAGSGSQAIHLGLVIRARARNVGMQVKLSTDQYWRRIRPFRFLDDTVTSLQDVTLDTRHVTRDTHLLLRTEPVSYAALAYVHLEAAQPPAEQRHKHNVGVVFDTNMTMSSYRVEEPEDLCNVLAPYIDSDFSHIFWGTGVGTYSPLYFSEALGYHGQEQNTFMADHRERTAVVMKMFAEKGIDPLKYALEFARANGLKLWANHRISKNHEIDFKDDYQGGRFLLKHQDKRVLQMDGTPHYQVPMSIAYPEIRDLAVRCLVEQARYGVDGIYIDFLRKYPIVGWEPPVYESFKKKFGIDPRTTPQQEWQVDWFGHLCSFVTDFLRTLRAELDKVGQELGRRMPVAVQVPSTWRFGDGIPSANYDGLDFVTWAKEGLIDIVAPAEAGALMNEHLCLDRIGPLLEGTGCKIWGAIGPQAREHHRSKKERAEFGDQFADLDPWRYMLSAHEMYSQGADGVYIWEAQDMPCPLQRWEVIRNLGDRELLRRTFGDRFGRFDGADRIEQTVLEG